MDLDAHVRVYDPAIDWTEGTGTPRDWPATRDPKKLVTKPGMTPTTFRCVRLARSLYQWCMSAESPMERMHRAFRCAVRSVVRPSGPWAPQGLDARDYRMMTEAEADEWGIADQIEIGGLILERSILPTDCEGGYTVQPSSQLVWAAMQRRSLSAAQSQAAHAETPKEPAASSVG